MHFVSTEDPPLQLQLTHMLQEGEIMHCCLFISSCLDRERLAPHCCCQRSSYTAERRKGGSCSEPSTAPHPTPEEEHFNSLDLSAIGSPPYQVMLSWLPLEVTALNLESFIKPKKHKAQESPIFARSGDCPFVNVCSIWRIAVGHCMTVQSQVGDEGSQMHRVAYKHSELLSPD